MQICYVVLLMTHDQLCLPFDDLHLFFILPICLCLYVTVKDDPSKRDGYVIYSGRNRNYISMTINIAIFNIDEFQCQWNWFWIFSVFITSTSNLGNVNGNEASFDLFTARNGG